MRKRLLWKLLLGNILPVIAVIILVVWLAIDQLAADYFTVLMEQFHIDPADSHRMFLTAIHRYLLWAALTALALALLLNYLLTRRILRPLFQMTSISQQMAAGNFSERVDVVTRDEVGQLAESFNHMADSLQKIEGLRKNMVADIAHELRTPLTNLRGYMEALSDGVIPPSRETFEMLQQEALRLVHLVEDLQQLARADAARAHLDRSELSLHRLLGQILDLYRPNFQERSIAVERQFEPGSDRVRADGDKVLQAIRNLVDNAWKYTPRGAIVSVSAVQTPEGVKVTFANTCEAMAQTDIPLLFERFFRVDRSRSRDVGGAGIGLAIVKELIEAHGGKVGADICDGWIRVWFTLP